MAILSKGTDFSTGDQVTAANLDALVDSATFASGAVDGVTTSLDSSSPQKIIVKNGGIGTNQLATSDSTTTGVTFAKMQHVAANTVLVRDASSAGDISAKAVANTQILIGDGTGFTAAALSGDVTMTNAGAVTIANDAVTNAKLADDAVDSAQIADGAIDEVHIASSAVTTAKLENSSSKTTGVTFAKMKHISTAKILGRRSSGEGDIEEAFDFKDEDNMSSNSATALASQQSIKAYVDASSADGFTPTSYTGGESVTLPNGLIMKWGEFNPSNGSNSVSYGNAFPTETINIQYARFKGTHSTYEDNNAVTSKSASGFNIYVMNGSAYGTLMWQAIGR